MAFWNAFTILPRGHRILILLLSSLLGGLLLWPLEDAQALRGNGEPDIASLPAAAQGGTGASLASDDSLTADAQPSLQERTHRVRRGDSLSSLFQRAGFSHGTLYEVTRAGGESENLLKLRPGEQLTFYQNEDGELAALAYPLNKRETLWIERTDGGYRCRVDKMKLDSRQMIAQGRIDSSLWDAGQAAGLSSTQILGLANIFAWDIDFSQDLQPGDRFTLIYEQLFKQGELIGTGKLLAAEFINDGQTFRAIRYRNGHYYTPDGQAMRKGFLRSPVNFRYITSHFNPRRRHPVTGLVRPHNGIDYGAPVGTPIMAAGDGVVSASASNPLNGNYVFIRHSGRHTTKYLHLSQRLVRTGQRVRQGQPIGKLGGTGRVTGPHLHYEFLVNGVHQNPRTVTLPQAEPLRGERLADFRLRAESLVARLNIVSHPRVAQANPTTE